MFIVLIVSVAGSSAFKQYLRHRENMELARQGIRPEHDRESSERQSDDDDGTTQHNNAWRGGLISAAVGVAILIGFVPLVINEPSASPALIGGLVPLLIGLAIMYGNKGGRPPNKDNMYEVRDDSVPTHKQHLLEENYDADDIIFSRTKDKISERNE